MRGLVILLLVVIVSPSRAGTDITEDSPVKLTVKPVLCITEAEKPGCHMSFLVIWQSDRTGYYCLYNDFQESALRCWSGELSGEVNDERTVQAEFSYWMMGDDTRPPLGTVSIEVLWLDTSDRRRKRRSRHVWDIL